MPIEYLGHTEGGRRWNLLPIHLYREVHVGYINGLLPTYTGLNRGDLQVILRQTFESKDSKDSYIKK